VRHVVPYVFPLIEREILISFRRERGENVNRARFFFFRERESVCVLWSHWEWLKGGFLNVLKCLFTFSVIEKF